MKLHRFIGEFDLNIKDIKILDKALVNQMFRVLKLQSGEMIVLCDGRGKEASARILAISDKQVDVRVELLNKVAGESSVQVVLFCSVLKRENFELVVQKATEIGIKEVVPLITERTIKQNIKLDRLQLIAKEAAEQSGRGIVPIVSKVIKFNDAIKLAKKMDINYFFHTKNSQSATVQTKKSQSIGIWIGPEGGWTDTEEKTAKEVGFIVKNLGKLVFRAETAAIVASYETIKRAEAR